MKTTNNTVNATNSDQSAYSDDYVDTYQDTADSIYEVQQYFDAPLRGDSCCGDQAHMFLMEVLSRRN